MQGFPKKEKRVAFRDGPGERKIPKSRVAIATAGAIVCVCRGNIFLPLGATHQISTVAYTGRRSSLWDEQISKICVAYSGSVRLTPYSICLTYFLAGTVLFSHNNSTRTVFSASFSQYSASRTEQHGLIMQHLNSYIRRSVRRK